MKIALVNSDYEERFKTEDDLLRVFYTAVGWAEALSRAGCEVTVISRFRKDGRIVLNGVEYVFVSDGLRPQLRSWEIPLRFLSAIAALRSDVVHLHQFTRSPQTLVLRALLSRSTGIVIQHHGGKTVHGWKMRVHNAINSVADGYFFTAIAQGLHWFRKGRQSARVMSVMEGGTFFDFDTRDAQRQLTYKDRHTARRLTGMDGDPVCLWVGRLDENKDPLTVLRGFEMLLHSYPNARLYMIYGEKGLESELKAMIDDSDCLKKSVVLLGKLRHADLEKYYDSADYFVLGSHYEGSSYSLSEALSCGCIPIVTDIPSLRMMTNNGTLGALWQPDDPHSFLKAAIVALQKDRVTEANHCIDFFRSQLCFDAIARIALTHYRKISQQRRPGG